MSQPEPGPSVPAPEPGTNSAPARPVVPSAPVEIDGRDGPEPVRYGDWEKNGRCIDF